MTNVQTTIEKMINEVDPINAEYILNDRGFMGDAETAGRFEAKGDTHMVDFMLGNIEKNVREYSSQNLTPANVKVGDGVTMNLYSDAHAGTIVKVTKTSVTVQRDNATRDPNWKPEMIAGGFAGHCTNQHTQAYTYEQDKDGETMTFRWSKKFSKFKSGKMSRSLSKGRHEFYDYNF